MEESDATCNLIITLTLHMMLGQQNYISRHLTIGSKQQSSTEKDLLNKHINHVTLFVDTLGKSQVFCNHKLHLALLVLHITSWEHAKSSVLIS